MKKLLLAALAVAGLATACRKDNDVVTCPAPGPASLDALTKRYGPPVQVFEFDPKQPQIIHTAGGARLFITANAFVHSNGTVPSGPLKLLFQEIYSPAEMVLANMPTMAWSRNQSVQLESGGEFNIRVKEKTTDLPLQLLKTNRSSDGKLIMNSPAISRILTSASVTQMTQWVRSPWFLNPDSLIWMERDTFTRAGNPVLTVNIPFIPDSITGQGGTFLTTSWVDTLGWMNIDVLHAVPGPRVKVGLSLDGGLAQTRVFFVPAGINGVFRPSLNVVTNTIELINIPQSIDLTAVVLRVKDGKYYFGTHRALTAPGFTYRPVLEEVSEEELVRRIRLL